MKYVREILWIIAFTLLGEVLNRLLKLPVPAGVYGLFLMLLALLFGIIRLEDVEGAGNFLLDTMTIIQTGSSSSTAIPSSTTIR